jgi:hypothetical protein
MTASEPLQHMSLANPLSVARMPLILFTID